MPPIVITSPRPLQVIQRHTVGTGEVRVSGYVTVPFETVRATLSGPSLQGELKAETAILDPLPVVGGFEGVLMLPAGGWYEMTVEALRGREVVAAATVDRFGVGEVFVAAGQSNSTNSGEFPTAQTSGMVSSFSGSNWRLADDPQPGCHDETTGGSPWPAFGDALHAAYGVPIGIASTGHGGTSVNQWAVGDELFGWLMTRIWQLGPGGFRALLWHQGESDVAMAGDEYERKLTAIIRASQALAGWHFPWGVAKVSYLDPANPRFESTRRAHQHLWDTGVAFAGPDTDDLVSDHRDYGGAGIHFSPAGLRAHGEMWAKRVRAWLDPVLGGPGGDSNPDD